MTLCKKPVYISQQAEWKENQRETISLSNEINGNTCMTNNRCLTCCWWSQCVPHNNVDIIWVTSSCSNNWPTCSHICNIPETISNILRIIWNWKYQIFPMRCIVIKAKSFEKQRLIRCMVAKAEGWVSGMDIAPPSNLKLPYAYCAI